MPCPNHECPVEFSDEELQLFLPGSFYQKYLIFRKNEELNNCPFLHWCPVPDCMGYDIGNINKDQLTCNSCAYQYCYYCGEAWHGKTKCKANIDKELDQWSYKNGVKYCPKCRRKVQKTFGCDHMTCIKCKHEWCWLCGENYSGNHTNVCSVKKMQRWNPPIARVLLMIFSPIVLLFMPIAMLIAWIEKVIRHPGRISGVRRKIVERRYLSYPAAFVVGAILLPFYLTIGPFIASIGFSLNFMDNCWGDLNLFLCIFVPIFAIAGTPVLVVLSISAVVIFMILGCVLMLIKVYVYIRKCIDPRFLTIKGGYGYVLA